MGKPKPTATKKRVNPVSEKQSAYSRPASASTQTSTASTVRSSASVKKIASRTIEKTKTITAKNNVTAKPKKSLKITAPSSRNKVRPSEKIFTTVGPTSKTQETKKSIVPIKSTVAKPSKNKSEFNRSVVPENSKHATLPKSISTSDKKGAHVEPLISKTAPSEKPSNTTPSVQLSDEIDIAKDDDDEDLAVSVIPSEVIDVSSKNQVIPLPVPKKIKQDTKAFSAPKDEPSYQRKTQASKNRQLEKQPRQPPRKPPTIPPSIASVNRPWSAPQPQPSITLQGTSKSSQVPPKSPQVPPKSSQVPPKSSQVPPKSPQVPPKSPQVLPKSPQVPPKSPQVPPKSPQILPKSPQVPPKSPHALPKSPQVPPKSSQIPPKPPQAQLQASSSKSSRSQETPQKSSQAPSKLISAQTKSLKQAPALSTKSPQEVPQTSTESLISEQVEPPQPHIKPLNPPDQAQSKSSQQKSSNLQPNAAVKSSPRVASKSSETTSKSPRLLPNPPPPLKSSQISPKTPQTATKSPLTPNSSQTTAQPKSPRLPPTPKAPKSLPTPPAPSQGSPDLSPVISDTDEHPESEKVPLPSILRNPVTKSEHPTNTKVTKSPSLKPRLSLPTPKKKLSTPTVKINIPKPKTNKPLKSGTKTRRTWFGKRSSSSEEFEEDNEDEGSSGDTPLIVEKDYPVDNLEIGNNEDSKKRSVRFRSLRKHTINADDSADQLLTFGNVKEELKRRKSHSKPQDVIKRSIPHIHHHGWAEAISITDAPGYAEWLHRACKALPSRRQSVSAIPVPVHSKSVHHHMHIDAQLSHQGALAAKAICDQSRERSKSIWGIFTSLNKKLELLKELRLPLEEKLIIRQEILRDEFSVDPTAGTFQKWLKPCVSYFKYHVILRMKRAIPFSFYPSNIWRSHVNKIKTNYGYAMYAYFRWIRTVFLIHLMYSLVIMFLVGIPHVISYALPESSTDAHANINALSRAAVISLANASERPDLDVGESTHANDLPENGGEYNTHTVANKTHVHHRTSFIDVFTGRGFLTNSAMFYGHYSNDKNAKGLESTSLRFLLTILALAIIDQITIGRKLLRHFKYQQVKGIQTDKYGKNAFRHIFTLYDFNCEGKKPIELMKRSIRRELAELRNFIRSGGKRNTFYMPKNRCLLNLCNDKFGVKYGRLLLRWIITGVCLLITVIYSVILLTILEIRSVTETSVQGESTFVLNPTFVAVPSLIFTIMDLFYGKTCILLAKYEPWRFIEDRNRVTIYRSSLPYYATFLVFYKYWHTKVVEYQVKDACWETMLGSDLYRFIVLQGLLELFFTLAYEIFRIVFRWRRGLRLRISPIQPESCVMNLMFVHTIGSFGFLFSPMLCVVVVIRLLVTFYFRSYLLTKYASLPKDNYQFSDVNAPYLRLFVISSLLTTFFSLFSISELHPSKHCGPFQSYEKYFHEAFHDAIGDTIIYYILKIISSRGFQFLLIFLLCGGIYVGITWKKIFLESLLSHKNLLQSERNDRDLLLRAIYDFMRIHSGDGKASTTFTKAEKDELAQLERRLEAAVHARDSFEVDLEAEDDLDDLEIEQAIYLPKKLRQPRKKIGNQRQRIRAIKERKGLLDKEKERVELQKQNHIRRMRHAQLQALKPKRGFKTPKQFEHIQAKVISHMTPVSSGKKHFKDKVKHAMKSHRNEDDPT